MIILDERTYTAEEASKRILELEKKIEIMTAEISEKDAKIKRQATQLDGSSEKIQEQAAEIRRFKKENSKLDEELVKIKISYQDLYNSQRMYKDDCEVAQKEANNYASIVDDLKVQLNAMERAYLNLAVYSKR